MINHVEYLTNFFQKYPDQFRTMFRSLIASSGVKDWQSLEYMSKNMAAKDVNALMFGLTLSEKESFKRSIGKHSPSSPEELMKYIKGQLVGMLIAFQPLVDQEVWEIALKLRTSEVLKFCESYNKEGSVLLNILTPSFLSKILDSVPLDKSFSLMEQALQGDLNAMEVQKLKVALQSYFKTIRVNTFSSKIFKALHNIESSKEKMIYKHLLTSIEPQELTGIVVENFPLDLIWYLSISTQKELLQSYPLVKKAKLLLSFKDQEKEKLMDAISANGSSARQMLEMEISRIQDSSSELKLCRIQKEFIFKEFINFCRAHIETNPSLIPEIKIASFEWLQSLSQESVHHQAA
jgi:hypothetical protein